jgi:hypothetical protein
MLLIDLISPFSKDIIVLPTKQQSPGQGLAVVGRGQFVMLVTVPKLPVIS